MASNGSHSQLVVIHKSNDVRTDVGHVVAFMVVRATLVSVVQEPYVSLLSDLRFGVPEELLKVFSLLDHLGKPNEGWHVVARGGKELASELDIAVSLAEGGLWGLGGLLELMKRRQGVMR